MIIKTKLITIIALTIILTVGITTAFVIKMQNDKMVEAKLQDTIFLCDIIERTTESAMKEGNTGEVQKIIENIGKNKEVMGLRIIAPDGTILKSVHRKEIGTKSLDFIESSERDRYHKPTIINDTTINYFRRIDNRKECFGCHQESLNPIGVVQITQDVSRDFTTFLSLKRTLIFSNLFIVILVSTTLSLLFSRLVMNPLKNLLVTIHDVESGNWKASVKVNTNDELGVIGTSFNKMIGEITKLYNKNITKERELAKIRAELEHKNKVEDLNSQLEFKIKELQTANKAVTSLSREVKNKNIELEKAVEKLQKISEVGRILTSIIETQELMKIIIQTTADLLNAEKITMHLKNSHKPATTIKYHKGGTIESITDLSFEMNQQYMDLFTSGKPVFIPGPAAGQSGSGSQIGVPLKMKGRIIGAMLLENGADGTSFTEDELDILTTLSNHAMVAIENASLYESLKSNYFSTIQSLVNALEASDRFTRGHSERVRLLSLELGKQIGLDFSELELLEHASILHDIGKIGIDNFILQKQGKLTIKEYGLVKTHPLIGDEILGPIETMEDVRKTIIQHHERYDGSGYPYGLQGDEISLKSKILSVVDTFDAMMTDRPYRKALTLQIVKEEIRSNAGSQFDPFIVEAFVGMLDSKGEELLAACGYTALYSSL